MPGQPTIMYFVLGLGCVGLKEEVGGQGHYNSVYSLVRSRGRWRRCLLSLLRDKSVEEVVPGLWSVQVSRISIS